MNPGQNDEPLEVLVVLKNSQHFSECLNWKSFGGGWGVLFAGERFECILMGG